MKSTAICKGCGKTYETSFLGWQNADLCKECFNTGGVVTTDNGTSGKSVSREPTETQPATVTTPAQPTTRIIQVSTSGPVGIGGWLLFFCLVLIVFTPLIGIFVLATAYAGFSPFFDLFPGLRVIMIIDSILSTTMMCFGIYAGISLWKRRKGAVQSAKRYLIALLIYAGVALFLPFMAGLPSPANQAMQAGAVIEGFRSILFFVIWYTYLNKSKRVRNTFAEPGDPISIEIKKYPSSETLMEIASKEALSINVINDILSKSGCKTS